MHILQVDKITINHAGRVIFRDLSWVIGDHDRTGLVGPNGAGKSSLFKAIIGEVQPEVGTVTRMNGVSVGYLPQEVTLTAGSTVYKETMTLPPELAAVDAELSRLEARLASPDVYNNPDSLAKVLARQEKALEQYEALGGPHHAGRVRDLLTQLGFMPEHYDLPVEVLSGGQKKLVALIRLMMEAPDILLLDEPDNHLDLEAKQRLESTIKDYDGSIVIISHDRYLLDEVATTIAELDSGQIKTYKGNYTAYTTERELRRLRQQQMYVAQQKTITKIEAAIARFEHWAHITEDQRHMRQARSRRKMLDRMEANGEIVEKVVERRQMALQLNGFRGSTKAIELKNLAMAFDDNLLFTDVNMLLMHGERVGLVGPNGAGKSVLFKLLLGQLEPLDGIIKIGPSMRIGYYSQEHQTLTAWYERTALERVRDIAPMTEHHAIALLGKFLFTYEMACQPIGKLSGGERSRLQLACLMLEEPNLLLLDEPTNNLDIPSSEALENALDDFEGALLVISHDRYFLDQVVDRVVELDGGLRSFEGGYTDYLAVR
jgi:ATP-binding cassette, subfamily F, member 3